jgi:hypothetical protein
MMSYLAIIKYLKEYGWTEINVTAYCHQALVIVTEVEIISIVSG